MKFNWDKTINGFRLIALRDFLRKNFAYSTSDGITAEGVFRRVWRRVSDNYYFLDDASFDLQKERCQKECEASINALLDGGFIKRTLRENSYTLTDLGASFWVSSPKRYRRAAAQKQLDIFLERCREINARTAEIKDPESLCSVQKVIVFGSFARGEDPVGDIDIFIQLEVRDLEAVRKYQQRLSRRKLTLEQEFALDPQALALKYIHRGLTIIRMTSRIPNSVPPSEKVVYL